MIVFISIIAVFGIYFIFTSLYYGYYSWFKPQEFLDKSDPLIKQKKTSYHFIPDALDDMLIDYFGNKKLYLWFSRVGSVFGILIGLFYLYIVLFGKF